MTKPTDFAQFTTRYLTNYLPAHCNSSPNTILAYRDMFKLLLRFAENERGIAAEKITVKTINKDFVEGFLGWIESQGRGVSTRNHRLSALHAFFRYIQKEEPIFMVQCQQILSISVKKKEKPVVNYLDVEAIRLLVNKPDTSDKYGLRDNVLLGLLYEAGIRVSELTELRPMDLQLKQPATVTVMGKGRKMRSCPIPPVLCDNLTEYLARWHLNLPEKDGYPLFVNHMGSKINRAGVTYIIKKYVNELNKSVPGTISSGVSPHVLRHSKAMHMLQADVNLIYIRDYLGHEQLQTTEIYARANPEMKRAAIDKAASVTAIQSYSKPWIRDGDLMGFLNSLGN